MCFFEIEPFVHACFEVEAQLRRSSRASVIETGRVASVNLHNSHIRITSEQSIDQPVSAGTARVHIKHEIIFPE